MNKKFLVELYLKYRFFVYPVTLGVLSMVLITLLIVPQVTKLLANQQSLQQINNRIDNLQTKVSELQGVDESSLDTKLNLALNALPDQKDYSKITGIIQTIISQYGFNMVVMQVGSQPVNGLGSGLGYSIKMEMLGPKSTFLELLRGFETSARSMRVSNIEVIPTRAQDIINVVLTVDAFYAPVPLQIGGVDDPLPKLTEEDEKVLSSLAKNTSFIESQTSQAALSPRGKPNPFE